MLDLLGFPVSQGVFIGYKWSKIRLVYVEVEYLPCTVFSSRANKPHIDQYAFTQFRASPSINRLNIYASISPFYKCFSVKMTKQYGCIVFPFSYGGIRCSHHTSANAL